MRKLHFLSMLMFVAVLTVAPTVKAAVPQLINYQGRLTDTPGSPLSGDYEITFKLYDTPSGGASIWSETHSAVTVSDGLFAVALGSITPFSSASPAGNQIWLGITVGSDPELAPRTQMVSVIFAFMADRADTASYAHQAGSVDTAGFSYQARQADTADYANRSLFSDTADYAGRSLFSDTADYAERSLFSDTADIAKGATNNSIGSAQLIDNNVTSLDIEDGTILSIDIAGNTINGSDIATGAVSSDEIANATIQLEDLADMGATDGQIMKWNQSATSWITADEETGGSGWIDDGTIVRLTTIDDSVGIGTATPSAKLDVVGDVIISGKATIGSGHTNSNPGGFVAGLNNIVTGDLSTVGGGKQNTASGNFATVGGGEQNTASGNFATVGGGIFNIASSTRATVGGGIENLASSSQATVGGGSGNTASSSHATVGGGITNLASAPYATIPGGFFNTASGDYATVGGGITNLASAPYATIPGGWLNTASGNYSFAAGRRAKANHNGSFVWADQSDADVSSSVADQFNVRASGGTRIYSNSALSAGVTLAAGASSWAMVSDSALKRNVREVDYHEVLEKVAALPISQWSYEAQDESIEHIGPMAQDFYRLFGLGEDDKHINTLDPDGVALAAIKALYEKSKRVDALEASNEELENRLSRLEEIIDKLNDK